MDHMIIRQEDKNDFIRIRDVVKSAFATAQHSDGDEHNLVDRIRASEEYIPQLSLVAIKNGSIVGHLMMSKITLGLRHAVAIAPLSVHPDFQKSGIGRLLIEEAHRKAREMGYTCCVVLGHPGYYSKFGYVRASSFGIYPPFDVPDECYMVCPFVPAGTLPCGTVRYSAAFV